MFVDLSVKPTKFDLSLVSGSLFFARAMVRVQLVRYWKRYLTKGRYRCRRYLFYVPVSLGDRLDRSVDYAIHLFGPLIVLVPKGMQFSLSMLEKLENAHRRNHDRSDALLTNSLPENTKSSSSGD
jgi:hypothetical protein